jgi:hypothetical protein
MSNVLEGLLPYETGTFAISHADQPSTTCGFGSELSGSRHGVGVAVWPKSTRQRTYAIGYARHGA